MSEIPAHARQSLSIFGSVFIENLSIPNHPKLREGWAPGRGRRRRHVLFGLGDTRLRLESEAFSTEEEDQLYDQDDDNGQLEQKSAALIELIDHVPVEILGDMHLRGDDIPVICHANPRGSQPIQTRGKHVA